MSFGNLSNMQMASAGYAPMGSSGAQRLDTSKTSSISPRSLGPSSMGTSSAGGGGGFNFSGFGAGGMGVSGKVK